MSTPIQLNYKCRDCNEQGVLYKACRAIFLVNHYTNIELPTELSNDEWRECVEFSKTFMKLFPELPCSCHKKGVF